MCIKKIIVVLFFIFPKFCASQIHARYVFIEAQGFKMGEACTLYDAQGQHSTSDTIGAKFSSSTFPGLKDTNDVITSDQGYRGYDGFDHWATLDIEIDTVLRKIKKLYAKDSEGHSTYMGSPWYWVDEAISVSAENLSYYVSRTRDTLSVILNAAEMRISKIGIDKTSDSKYPHSGEGCNASFIISILDDANFKVIITGSFPLSVNSGINKLYGLIIDPISKVLSVYRQTEDQNQPLPCFDLLGRKHNLEFLGSDGVASTYSVRSFPTGVYFVSDGKRIVKFLIGE